MSKRTPNSEQLLAIQHQGGVLLKAGAGSGKTFVLVEHIIYLTELWIQEYKTKRLPNFEEFIRQKFSSVVMMTFTKKAAGEMSTRLAGRFVEMTEEHATSQDGHLWATANECLSLLMVTTIDGFCRKLISSGYFPHLSTEAKVIFGPERIDQVRELLEAWFETHSTKIDPEVLDIIVREKRSLLSAFSDVFNDPGLRLLWKSFDLSSSHPDTLGKIIAASFQLNDLATSLYDVGNLELPHEKERSAFEKLVGEFQSSGLPVIDSVEKLQLYQNLFAPIKVLRGESGKKKTPAHEAAKEGLANLRSWVSVWSEVIQDYVQHYDQKVLPWMELCQELFTWIDERLDPNQGMTFGDIEYLVARGLENPSDRERIQKIFQYFIVDEFQDTSYLQFKIIQGLIGEDYSRLFCVGDAKQAIYGFRGGELSVFQDCSRLVPQVLTLANNYRSLPTIINFNNSLFGTLLPLGQEFQGLDPFTVAPEDQNVPSDNQKITAEGEIEIISAQLERDLETEDKFSNEDINRLEAHLIADSIEKERRDHPDHVCSVLYSKLKPSAELIRALMTRNVGFTAQFKIDLLDDPVIGIFLSLVRRQFDSNPVTRDRYPLFLLESYLKVLGLAKVVKVEDLIEFDHSVRYWGLIEGFRKFLHKLHVTNENSDINMAAIETISHIYHQDPESIMIQLKDGDNQRISLDLRSGEEAHMVQIMTAHASKGLEFGTVYLAGIYTNGRENHDSSLFGSQPGSFHWFIDLARREKQKSPQYLLESELEKYKNFSESKRLFYVACTRAENKLVWVDFDIPEKAFSIPKNSWIDGLTTWFEKGLPASLSSNVKVTRLEDFDGRKILQGSSLPQLPLFFHDPMGIFPKGEGESELAIAAELSVTRLNSLLDCPRKFYFSNILKLQEPKKNYVPVFEEEEGEELATVMTSSASRGTFLHAQISQGIERNFIVPRAIFSTEHKEPVEWALGLLRGMEKEYELLSEKQIKFKFFNFMISGIPDLVLLPKGNQKAQVWDFKTGRITEENLSHYWLQLSTYAYALYVLGNISVESEIELVLCFVDQKKTLNLSVTFEKCKRDLYPIWRSQNEPWKTNPDHCGQCPYGSICPR